MIIPNYTFDASAKTVRILGLTPVIEGIKLITNLTRGVVIYQFNDAAKGGTLTGDILTIEFDTAAHDDADKLMIIYEIPTVSEEVPVISSMLTAVSEYAQTIAHYLRYLTSPGWYDRTMNRLRVFAAIESGTVTTVTTVTTVSNQTSIGGVSGQIMAYGANNAAWALMVRSRIS